MNMIKIFLTVAFVLVVVFIVYKQQDSGVTEQAFPITTRDDTNKEQSEVPEEINTTVTNTEILNLSSQKLENIPSYVFDRTNIHTLDLSNNNLGGSLPSEVRQLQSLKVLDLSNNKFTGVPAEIGQLKNLEKLDLSNNEITGLPYELGNLSNLKLLNLQGNNYAPYDLEIIKKTLPSTTEVLLD